MKIMRSIIRGVKLALWAASHRKPRAAYVGGWLGHNNLGDEALFEAYKELFSGVCLYQVRGYREEATLARITRAFDSAVLAGGTMIGNNPNFLARSQRMFNIARHRFVFGTGVANYEFWKDKKISDGKSWRENLSLWCSILERCDYVGVRGPQSQKTLFNAGLKNVEVVGDPVLVFADCSKSVNYHNKTLGLNFGFGGEHMWDSQKKLFEKIVKLASLARNAGWKVVWFVVWPKDHFIIQNAAKASKTDEHIYTICTDHTKYMNLVSDLTVFVGMKLHAVALATCAGVPSIMLEYRPKCRDYMKSIQQDHLCERIDLFEAEKVWQRVLDIQSNREQYAAKMAEAISQLQAFQKQKAGRILEIIQCK